MIGRTPRVHAIVDDESETPPYRRARLSIESGALWDGGWDTTQGDVPSDRGLRYYDLPRRDRAAI